MNLQQLTDWIRVLETLTARVKEHQGIIEAHSKQICLILDMCGLSICLNWRHFNSFPQCSNLSLTQPYGIPRTLFLLLTMAADIWALNIIAFIDMLDWDPAKEVMRRGPSSIPKNPTKDLAQFWTFSGSTICNSPRLFISWGFPYLPSSSTKRCSVLHVISGPTIYTYSRVAIYLSTTAKSTYQINMQAEKA